MENIIEREIEAMTIAAREQRNQNKALNSHQLKALSEYKVHI
jgi:hypothetical protein